jgi:hypothetical protein
MRTVVQTIIVALAVACCASACAQTLTGTATITDADTIVVGGETIRLQGVDAPETDQICLDSRARFGIAELTRATDWFDTLDRAKLPALPTAKMYSVVGSRPAPQTGAT